jgi:hypothetical protein
MSVGNLLDTARPPFQKVYAYDPNISTVAQDFPDHQETWFNRGNKLQEMISAGLRQGQYRLIFQPTPLIWGSKGDAAWNGGFSPNYGWCFQQGALTFASAPVIRIISKDTITLPAILKQGFSAFGSIRPDTAITSPLNPYIEVFIKEVGNKYLRVSEGFSIGQTTTGSTIKFEIPGLWEGQQYYIRINAMNFPSQFWSPVGNTCGPDQPYVFSTSTFKPLNILLKKNIPNCGGTDPGPGPDPGGPGMPVWLNVYHPDTGTGLIIKYSVDSRVNPSPTVMKLYRKYQSENPVLLATTSFVAGIYEYTFQDSMPARWMQYVLTAQAGDTLFRSSTIDFEGRWPNQVVPDSIGFVVAGERYGINMIWATDTAYHYQAGDSVTIWRQAPGESWAMLRSDPAQYNYTDDHWWSRTADSGKTFSYKAALYVRAQNKTRYSPIRTFTIDKTFLSRQARSLRVGAYETYQTIQAAINAAVNYDMVRVTSGTYRENLNISNKLISIEGEWGGASKPPVIDGNRGTAITIGLTSNSNNSDKTRIYGLKISNATIGIKAQCNAYVGGCLFVNVDSAIVSLPDSAGTAMAMKLNPFFPNVVSVDVYKCTFIARKITDVVFSGRSQGLMENPAFNTVAYSGRENNYMVPLLSVKPYCSIGNSVIYNTVPFKAFNLFGKYASANLNNSSFWRASFGSTFSQESNVFAYSPEFQDTVFYFQRQGTGLQLKTNNGDYIGYDGNQFNSGGGNGGGGGSITDPEPAPITGLVIRTLGFNKIGLKWNRSTDSLTVSYRVSRIAGKDSSNFYVKDGYWQPKIAMDQTFTIVDTFSTINTYYVDSTITKGMPYLYAVSGITAKGRESSPKLPGTSSFSSFLVNKYAYSANFKANSWTMAGIMGPASISAGASPYFKVFRWDPLAQVDKLYNRYVAPITIDPEKGYWFYSAKDTAISILSTLALLSTDTMKVHLDSGWNQVSSPYPYPVRPAWLASYDLWEWDAATNAYREAREFAPWKGYWMYSTTALSLDVRETVSDFLATNYLAKSAQVDGWQVQVSLMGDKDADPDNFIGVTSGLAKAARTQGLEPPPAFDHAQLYFVEGGAVAAQARKLAKEIRESPAMPKSKIEWLVGISPLAGNAQVQFGGLSNIPKDLYVFWVGNKQAVDLRKQNSISLTASSQTQYGYIIVTPNPYDIALYTGTLALKNSYPNPFSRQTSIEFVVPYSWNADGTRMPGEARELSLKIYNTAGQMIRTLTWGKIEVGYHRMVWDGAGTSGRDLPSGFYAAQLRCGDQQKAIRLLKIR